MDADDTEPPKRLPLTVEAILAEDPLETLAEIVVQLHAHADDDEYISRMGFGPIESLLHQGHGDALWPHMEHLARTDPLFRRALRSTWAYDSPEYDRREALLDELPDD
jgi:hypothetical protein